MTVTRNAIEIAAPADDRLRARRRDGALAGDPAALPVRARARAARRRAYRRDGRVARTSSRSAGSRSRRTIRARRTSRSATCAAGRAGWTSSGSSSRSPAARASRSSTGSTSPFRSPREWLGEHVVGGYFIHGVAAQDAGAHESAGGGRAVSARNGAPASRRRDRHRHRQPLGIGVEAFWDGVLLGARGGRADHAFRRDGYRSRIAAQIDDFDAARLREREADALDGSLLAVRDRRGAACDRRRAAIILNGPRTTSASTSARRSAAWRTPTSSTTSFASAGSRPSSRCWRSRSSAAPRRATSRSSSVCADRRSRTATRVPSGAVAIGDAFRADRARRRARRARRRRRSAALAARLRRVHHHSRDVDAQRRSAAARAGRSIARATASSWPRAPASCCSSASTMRVARGARVYGEIAGYGLTNDAYHMSAPRPDGAMNAAAMQRALDEAERRAGRSRARQRARQRDAARRRCETLAIEQVFGERLATLPVTATKGQHGHALGATGRVGGGALAAGDRDGIVPRSVNSDDADCGARADARTASNARCARCFRTPPASAGSTPRWSSGRRLRRTRTSSRRGSLRSPCATRSKCTATGARRCARSTASRSTSRAARWSRSSVPAAAESRRC